MTGSEKAAWRDPALGEPRELDLAQGRLRYFEAGDGAPIVFVHGLVVNANLWRKVVARVSGQARCVVLELPLGAHQLPMPEGTDLTPHGLADLIADAIDALGLEDVTLVGNDTGGALCQVVVTRRPERIGRLFLTSCDYRENLPPTMFKYLKVLGAVPRLTKLLMGPMRVPALRRLPFAYGWLAKKPLDRKAEDSYVMPVFTVRGIERDIKGFTRGLDNRYSIEAADLLRNFDKPTLIAWSREDRFFDPGDAERLARDLPDARIEWIEDAYTYSPEDQPERVAELLAGFVREDVPSTSL